MQTTFEHTRTLRTQAALVRSLEDEIARVAGKVDNVAALREQLGEEFILLQSLLSRDVASSVAGNVDQLK